MPHTRIREDSPQEGDTPLKLPVIREATIFRFDGRTLWALGTVVVGMTIFLTVMYLDVRDLKQAITEIKDTVKEMSRRS